MEKKLNNITEIKDQLVEWSKEEIGKGREMACTEELGEVVDMIKDLAEAEEKCWKACYYKSIVEAMKEAKEEEERYGYNPHRSATTGRYTSGYIMDETMHPDREMMPHMAQGYTPSGRGNRSQSGTRMSGRYGYHYDMYDDARRNYHETKDYGEKTKMNEHAKKHLEETVDTLEDIYREADPELKARIKKDITKLSEEMK